MISLSINELKKWHFLLLFSPSKYFLNKNFYRKKCVFLNNEINFIEIICFETPCKWLYFFLPRCLSSTKRAWIWFITLFKLLQRNYYQYLVFGCLVASFMYIGTYQRCQSYYVKLDFIYDFRSNFSQRYIITTAILVWKNVHFSVFTRL